MIRLTFEDLVVGSFYYRDDCGWVGKFVGMRNDQLAEFQDYTYSDDEFCTLIPTDNYSSLTKFELVFDSVQ